MAMLEVMTTEEVAMAVAAAVEEATAMAAREAGKVGAVTDPVVLVSEAAVSAEMVVM